MKIKIYKPFVWMTVLTLMVGLACNLSKLKPVATPTAVATPTPTQQTQSGAVSTIEDLEKAVVYIEVEGSYRDPSEGWKANVDSSGTGFIIDPSGIAVTNNHVVAGAAKLKIWVFGESEPRSAVVLGVSECSDLAVIDIDGEGFSFVEWYSGDIKVGLDVYTSGFPISGAGMGYSLTKGIISKTKGSVNWPTASVSNIIEHTAKVNPGNSGGPLTNDSGKVVGVNFGYTTLDQNYAIARDEAKAVVEKLRAGSDVDSLGINGVGVSGDLQGNPVVGVWVRSVKPGSPAEGAGILPGDIITKMDAQELNDGTLGGYCSVVRAHNPGDAFDVSVIRTDVLEVYEGQFNGNALAYVSTLSSQAGVTGEPTAGALGNPNASQSGEAFFASEFDRPENWSTYILPDTDQYQARTQDGKLLLEITPVKTGLYAFYDMALVNPDVKIETYAQKVAGPNTNNISLVCRRTSAGWYEFSMTSGGYWFIWLFEDGKGFTKLATGATTAINMKNKPNQLLATCIGKQLTFIINGVRVGSATDSTFLDGGQVGVSIYSEYPDLSVEFDYFKATVP
jgi:S1-C subfamily serine protease